jgi:hypothetical protein
LTIKTKEFQLNEENLFKNEIIHFFNIDAFNSIINIYLEVDGKRIKAEKSKKNFHELDLSEIEANNKKQEINCVIIEDAELKILVKIIRKYSRFFRKKSSKIIQYRKKAKKVKNKEKKNTQPPIKGIEPEISFKEKIKIFSGEFIRKQKENKILPGRLKIPEIFLQGENTKKSKKEEDKKDKDKDKENK